MIKKILQSPLHKKLAIFTLSVIFCIGLIAAFWKQLVPVAVQAYVNYESYTFDTFQDANYDGSNYTTSLDAPYVEWYDEDVAFVVLLHYRSWSEEAQSIDVNAGTYTATRQGSVVRENEYSTEAWVVTGVADYSNYVDVYWTGPVEDVTVEVYKFTYVSQTQPVAEVITNSAGTDVEQPNLAFSYTEYHRMFVGGITSYTGDFNTITADNGDGYNEASTINGYAASSYYSGSAYSDFTMSWTQSVNWHWSGIGLALREAGDEEILDPETPSISFTTAPSPGSTNGEVVRFAGTVTSTQPLVLVEYYLDEYVALTEDDYTVISPTEWQFDFELAMSPGSKTIYFYGETEVEGSWGGMDEISFEVVATQRPICILENLPSQISDTTPTYTATCTSDDGVAQASYRFYHEELGDIVSWTAIDTPDTGNWGDTSVTLSFTSPVELSEGAHLVYLDAKNNYNQWISTNGAEDRLPVDRIVVEAVDNRAPRLHVNNIEPNPTSDQQPFLTGICTDDYTTETNSYINLVEYRLNGGSWTSMYTYSEETQASSRIFEEQLPTLTVDQTHTIEVRCSDTAGNTTSISSQSVEVLAQDVEDPSTVTVTENFISQERKIPFYTDAVWGNGYLRLREKMTPEFTAVDTNNYMDRYGTTFNVSTYVVKQGTDNLSWYVKEDEIASYNTVTKQINTYHNTYFGANGFRDIAQVEDAEGNHLVWIAHNNGIILFNATSNDFIHYSHSDFDTSLRPNRIVTDSRDGRVGAYIRTDDPNSDPYSNIVYVDTNGSFLDSSDDAVEWFTTPAAFTYHDIYSVTLDEQNDALYMGKPGVGLVKVSDNGTPTDNSSYTGPTTYSVPTTVTDVAVDNANDAAFFITENGDEGGIYVITNISNDPWNLSNQDVTQLATSADVEQQALQFMHFLEGPEYVGNQLFIGTQQGKVFYYNTNNTYTNTSDDTLLTLELSQNLYPLAIGEFVIMDYDTLLVSYDRLGLYEVDLVRGWDTVNAAVVLAPLPTHRLNINNITLDALNIVTRIDSDGTVAPESMASATPYYTLDDGLNWTALTVGQTQNFNSDNYRLRFKIDLAQNPGTTPIVDEFNVSFGTYQEDPTTDNFGVSVASGSKWTDEDFEVTVQAQDAINFLTPEYEGDVGLQLFNATTDSEVDFTPTEVTLTEGTVTFSTRITTAGDYYLTATDGVYSGQSGTFTINEPDVSDPIPTMTFTANRYTITKGESATLSWSTAHFDTLSLSGVGNVSAVGSHQVTPETTTSYTLTGTSSYGVQTSSLTITVQNSSSDSSGGSDNNSNNNSDSSSNQSSSTTNNSSTTTSTSSQSNVNQSLSITDAESEAELDENMDDEESTESPVTFSIRGSNNAQKVRRGEKVRIEWNILGNPDKVFLDYWNSEISPVGHLDLIADKSVTLTFTATKDGKEYTETIEIIVENPSVFSWMRSLPALYQVLLAIAILVMLCVSLIWMFKWLNTKDK